MRLYLDTEFNGHGGELISMALCTPTAKDSWYGAWDMTGKEINPWVAENVMPKIDIFHPERGTADELRASLHGWLWWIRDDDVNIYADWPADFEHFTRILCGPSFDKALYLPCKMHLITTPTGEPRPKVPHNAMSDAQALMDWHEATLR